MHAYPLISLPCIPSLVLLMGICVANTKHELFRLNHPIVWQYHRYNIWGVQFIRCTSLTILKEKFCSLYWKNQWKPWKFPLSKASSYHRFIIYDHTVCFIRKFVKPLSFIIIIIIIILINDSHCVYHKISLAWVCFSHTREVLL